MLSLEAGGAAPFRSPADRRDRYVALKAASLSRSLREVRCPCWCRRRMRLGRLSHRGRSKAGNWPIDKSETARFIATNKRAHEVPRESELSLYTSDRSSDAL
jgi:hypothetical protein